MLDFGVIDHRLEVAHDVGELRTQRGIECDRGSSLNVSCDDHVRKGDPLPDEEGACSKVSLEGLECIKLDRSECGVDLAQHSMRIRWMTEKLNITDLLYGVIFPVTKNLMISVAEETSVSTRWIH
jgi:hypothetical protein